MYRCIVVAIMYRFMYRILFQNIHQIFLFFIFLSCSTSENTIRIISTDLYQSQL